MYRPMARLRAAKMVSMSISLVFEASQDAREALAEQIAVQLEDLSAHLIDLHRQLLELPPQRTPAACEFERADLDQSEEPF